jgi:hypothetical protein
MVRCKARPLVYSDQTKYGHKKPEDYVNCYVHGQSRIFINGPLENVVYDVGTVAYIDIETAGFECSSLVVVGRPDILVAERIYKDHRSKVVIGDHQLASRISWRATF